MFLIINYSANTQVKKFQVLPRKISVFSEPGLHTKSQDQIRYFFFF